MKKYKGIVDGKEMEIIDLGEKTKIEEERISIDDFKKDPSKYLGIDKPEEEKDKYERRAERYWKDIHGIANLLNNTSRGIHQIQDIRHPAITNYILWRILQEIKKSNLSEAKMSEMKDQLDKLMDINKK